MIEAKKVIKFLGVILEERRRDIEGKSFISMLRNFFYYYFLVRCKHYSKNTSVQSYALG